MQGLIVKELAFYYDPQCHYTCQSIRTVRQFCEDAGVPIFIIQMDALQKIKELPCVFNNWAVFYQGKFETVNLLDAAHLKRILKK